MSSPRNRGFTLIEMVVVVTIISILASIAIVNFRKVETKAQAARIATELHYIEEAVIEALLEGVTVADFPPMTRAANVDASPIGKYITRANLEDLPDGMTMSIASSAGGGPLDKQMVVIMIRADDSHRVVLDELQKMQPHEVSEVGGGRVATVKVKASTLAVAPVVPPTP